MKNPLTQTGIEPATFRFVAQHLNHCATAVPIRTKHTKNTSHRLYRLYHCTLTAVLSVKFPRYDTTKVRTKTFFLTKGESNQDFTKLAVYF